MNRIEERVGVLETAREIDVVHRIPTRSSRQHPKIVAQFRSRTDRSYWLEKKEHGIMSALFDKLMYLNLYLSMSI